MKRILALSIMALILLPVFSFAHAYSTSDESTLRALIIACDEFASQNSTAPSAEGNALCIRDILSKDIRGFGAVSTIINHSLDAQKLRSAIFEAFEGVKEGDTSYIYISTHGEYNGKGLEIIFSDGADDKRVPSLELYSILKEIPGVKVLMLDCCYSGGIIHKGVPLRKYVTQGMDSNIKVITSAGGFEQSYNWSSGHLKKQGTSHFMLALLQGIGEMGGYMADFNKDGDITIAELQGFLRQGLASSTAQVYPEKDSFVLLSYDKYTSPEKGIVSDLVFDSTVFIKGSSIDFSYTLNRKSRIAYQIITAKDGAWQFDTPQLIEDMEYGSAILWPGRKHKTLELGTTDDDTYGYALFFIVAVEENGLIPLASALLQAQSGEYEAIRLQHSGNIRLKLNEELAIYIAHKKPMSYSISVRNMQGDIVATPFIDEKSRPQRLGGTLIYWNGSDSMGRPLQRGSYTMQAEIRMGGAYINVFSGSFYVY
ncbi:MAG: caspase family protein [Christensenellaceae bacterium]|nr:caspase family protein [Christensenellaceae bacterium]